MCCNLKLIDANKNHKKSPLSPFFSSLYRSLWSPPPWLSAFPDKGDAGRQYWRWRHRGGCRAGEVTKYSFQMRFSPPCTICWIVLKDGAFKEGPAAERWKNLLRESERSRACIKSNPRGEGKRPCWHTPLWRGLLSCPLLTFFIWFSSAAHGYYCKLPEIGVTKGGWKDSDFSWQLFRSLPVGGFGLCYMPAACIHTYVTC